MFALSFSEILVSTKPYDTLHSTTMLNILVLYVFLVPLLFDVIAYVIYRKKIIFLLMTKRYCCLSNGNWCINLVH